MSRTALYVAAALAVGGAVWLSRTSFAKSLGPQVPGSGGEPGRVSRSDVRDGWAPTILEVKRPAKYCMLGCGQYWYLDKGSQLTNAPGGRWYAPGGIMPPGAGCRPPPDSSAGGRGPRRSWWAPQSSRYRDGGRPLPGVTDSEYLAGGESLTGPDEVGQCMAVTIGGAVYVRSDQTTNWSSLGVQGGLLWVGVEGYLATDAQGRDLRSPVITYKGQAVPPASWPGAVSLWKRVAEGRVLSTSAISRGQAHYGMVAPYDMVGPVYVWALLQRPRVLVSEVRR